MGVVLLVDGYNIIGAWPKLIKLRDRGDLEGARERLILDLVDFSHYRAWLITLVFDAQQGVPQGEILHGIEVYYTAALQTADTFIEQRSYQLLQDRAHRVIVATSDRAQRVLVEAQGADVLSAERLGQEVQRAKREQEQHQTGNTSKKGRTLADRLDPQTRHKLLNFLPPPKP